MQGPPKFPLLVDSGTKLYCLTGNQNTDIDLQQVKFAGKDMYPAIDSSATVYGYLPEVDMLSFYPLPELQTKKKLIELYNLRREEGSKGPSLTILSNSAVSVLVLL